MKSKTRLKVEARFSKDYLMCKEGELGSNRQERKGIFKCLGKKCYIYPAIACKGCKLKIKK